MLLSRNFKIFSRVPSVCRRFSSVKAVESPMDLSEHIAKYKTKLSSDNFMDLNSLPELGSPLSKLTGEYDEIQFNSLTMEKITMELMGPEPVSPHYENFGMSRRILLTFLGVTGLFTVMKIPGNMEYALDAAFGPFVFYTGLLYVFMEGRKSTILPLLNRFYTHAAQNEINNMLSSYGQNMLARFKERENYAREQLEYFDLHKEFKAIKNEAVEKLLTAEESFLKKHLHQRAVNLLDGAKAFEMQNQKKITSEVMSNIKAEMKEIKHNPSQQIKDDAFAKALEGIRKGTLDYGQDLVLQSLLKVARTQIDKVNNLSEQEKDAMLCLTETQLKNLKSADEMAQNEFLKKRPVGLEASFRDHEGFTQIVSKW